MVKYQMNQLKEGDMYWTPKFDETVKQFEPNYCAYDVGCWVDVSDGWAFDNEEECLAICKKLNEAIKNVSV